MTISKETTDRRTRKMIAREKGVSIDLVQMDTNLRDDLLYSDDEIRALEVPIETDDFEDVKANVRPSDLVSRKTVAGISGVIWAGIPEGNRK